MLTLSFVCQDYAASPPPVETSPFKDEIRQAIELAGGSSPSEVTEDGFFLDGYVQGYLAANAVLEKTQPFPFSQEDWSQGVPQKSPQRVAEEQRVRSPEEQRNKA